MQVISVNSLSRIFYHRQFSVRYLYCLPYNRYHSAIDFKSTSRRCYATSVAVPPPTIEVIPSGKLLNALGEPCLQALDLGCWYTPVGWVQCLLEMLHANLGLSWCASIALCSLILRTALFPIVIMNQKNAARVKYYSPKLSELQSTLMSARLRGDNFEALKAANELSIFMKKNRINPIRNIIPALIQVTLLYNL
ncbi:hypothetical protein GJ496_002413 [Pomphorhynchus laevis]|nr:hypothetical protein GJ496_002413 [Pomphorhynchus laevis]